MSGRIAILKKIALTIVALTLLWWLLAWQLLPRVLHSQAVAFLASRGHQLDMDPLHFNPFTLRLDLANLRLADPAGAPLLEFQALAVDLSAASLWRRAIVFDAIEWQGPVAHFALQQQGRSNWSALLESLQDDEPKAPRDETDDSLPRLEIRHFALRDGAFAFSDEPRSFTTRVTPIAFELNDLSTVPSRDGNGRYHMNARTSNGAQLDWQGLVGMHPLKASGAVSLQRFDLDVLAPYLQELRPKLAATGQLSLHFDYAAGPQAGGFAVSLDNLNAEIVQLQLSDTQSGARLSIARIAAEDGSYQGTANRLRLGGLSLQDDAFTLQPANGDGLPLLQLAEITLGPAEADLESRQFKLTAARARDGRVQLMRDANGQIDLLEAIRQLAQGATTAAQAPEPAVAPASAQEIATSPPPSDSDADALSAPAEEASGEAAEETITETAGWRYAIDRIELADFAFDWQDQSTEPAATLRVQDINITAMDFSEDRNKPIPLTATLQIASGGQVTASGELVPASGELGVDVKLSDLALDAAQPYLSEFLKLRIVSGTLNIDGKAQRVDGKSRFDGGFSLRQLRLDETEDQSLFLALQQLSTKKLALHDTGIDIDTLTLSGLDTKLHITEDRSLNLGRLLRKSPEGEQTTGSSGGEAREKSPVPAASGQPVGANAASQPVPAFMVGIEQLRIRNSALDFSDHSLALPFGTHIRNLRGVINGLSTRPGRRARIELDGQVDQYGMARATGQLDVSDPTGFSDIQVTFRNVEMNSLTPYSATFAGRRIDSGKLSLNLEYRIQQRQLQGDNQIIMEQLTLGERVDSPEAKNLPLDLAIALLQDSDGRIDLGLPVSGSLDDPQFSVAGVVWKAFTNIIGKIATAPFRALGALFGGSGEGFDSVMFNAGSGKLDPPEQEKLQHLASALAKRPALQLRIQGIWTEADRLALQDRELRVALAQAAGMQAADDTSDPGPLSTTSPQVQQALEQLYAERVGKDGLAALKEGFRQANPGELEPGTAERMRAGLRRLIHKPEALDAATIAQLQGADFHAVLYERLQAGIEVNDQQLQALAERRVTAMQDVLSAAEVPAERLQITQPTVGKQDGREVAIRMELLPASKKLQDGIHNKPSSTLLPTDGSMHD